jgi:hypothetical protein
VSASHEKEMTKRSTASMTRLTRSLNVSCALVGLNPSEKVRSPALADGLPLAGVVGEGKAGTNCR